MSDKVHGMLIINRYNQPGEEELIFCKNCQEAIDRGLSATLPCYEVVVEKLAEDYYRCISPITGKKVILHQEKVKQKNIGKIK